MSIVDNVKELATLIKKYNDQDLYQRIVDLRDEIFALREENLELKEDLRSFKAAADVSAGLQRDGNVYFRTDAEGKKIGAVLHGLLGLRTKVGESD